LQESDLGGLRPFAGRDYFRAVSRLLSLGGDISVDLVEVERAPARLRDEILLEAWPYERLW
jgi:hypothetical protein